MKTRLIALLIIASIASLLAGCDRQTEQAQPAKENPAMKPVSAHGATSAAGAIKFNAPAEWLSETPTSSMRQAQYRLPRVPGDTEDAELVVFYFQGGGGGVQANIDSWIGQFTKADGSPANDIAKTSHKTSHSIPITIVDVTGTYVAVMGPAVIILTGGEPLLREDIPEITEFGHGLGHRMVMAVNGTLLTPEMARRLKDAGIQRLSISLDGATAARDVLQQVHRRPEKGPDRSRPQGPGRPGGVLPGELRPRRPTFPPGDVRGFVGRAP